jgi:hypothetical protein
MSSQLTLHTPPTSGSKAPNSSRQSNRLRHAELPDLNGPVVLHPDIVEGEVASAELLQRWALSGSWGTSGSECQGSWATVADSQPSALGVQLHRIQRQAVLSLEPRRSSSLLSHLRDQRSLCNGSTGQSPRTVGLLASPIMHAGIRLPLGQPQAQNAHTCAGEWRTSRA